MAGTATTVPERLGVYRHAPQVARPEARVAGDFEQVLAAARAGAEWAWARLYDELAPAVRGYLAGQGAPDPDDLTGEVFLSVVRDLRRFDGDEQRFRSWVFTIAHHRLIDDARRRRRRAGLLRRDDPSPMVEPEEATGGAVDATAEAALARLGSERVRELLAVLTPEQREVILLRVLAGLSVAETARVVGRRPGAVKALQHRALRALRAHLGVEAHPVGHPVRSEG